MTVQTLKEKERAKEVIYALFNDTGFSGFSFDTSFKLRFYRNNAAEYQGKTLPWEIQINILTDWWFGSKEDWIIKVSKMSCEQLQEQDEPIKAYELAYLRWMEDSVVQKVIVNDNTMEILFRNGKQISMLLESEEDYAWTIEEPNVLEPNALWSVACENCELFVRIP